MEPTQSTENQWETALEIQGLKSVFQFNATAAVIAELLPQRPVKEDSVILKQLNFGKVNRRSFCWVKWT